MDILIIEDNEFKAKELVEFITENYTNTSITIKTSYKDALKEILYNNDSYAMYIIDITLPRSNPDNKRSQVKPEHFAGEEILKEMKRHNIHKNFILFTAFTHFGEEGREMVAIDKLAKRIKSQHEHYYHGCIKYQSGSKNWMNELQRTLKRIIK